jgi:transposase
MATHCLRLKRTSSRALLGQVPSLAACVAVAQRLSRLLRRKSKESLDDVLEDAAGTALKTFVMNLRPDLPAVQAALDLPWTTSPAEGQIVSAG